MRPSAGAQMEFIQGPHPQRALSSVRGEPRVFPPQDCQTQMSSRITEGASWPGPPCPRLSLLLCLNRENNRDITKSPSHWHRLTDKHRGSRQTEGNEQVSKWASEQWAVGEGPTWALRDTSRRLRYSIADRYQIASNIWPWVTWLFLPT